MRCALLTLTTLALLAANAVQAAETVTEKYDALGRLIESTTMSGPNNGAQTIVSYDAAGNRSSYVVSGVPQQVSSVLSISNPPAVVEGNTLVFTATRSGNVSGVTTVSFSASDGTALSSGKFRDYIATSGVLSFAAGETAKAILVVTISDTRIEDNETMFISLSSPSSGASISASSATGTILQKTF